jgi:hypothetical protein
MASVADLKPQAGFGFRASAAFPVLKPIAMLTFWAGHAPDEVQRLSRGAVTPPKHPILALIIGRHPKSLETGAC